MPIQSVSELTKTGLSQLDYTQYLLSGLTVDQLEAIQALAIVFLKDNDMIDESEASVFQPQSEAQLLSRIDHSLSQIDAGLFSDAEEFEAELLSEI